jgi:DNA mismatch repair protein MutL
VPTIRILDDRLVSQIAAGEVVERPASVVKELVENALDAGATRLEIDLESGGRQRVRVADDGGGMDRDDALLAFDRHATSKIRSFADLERVASLGFRGEALASIAAVARVELTTARGAGEGTRVRLEGGRVLGAEPMARDRGTTVDVGSLFFNVPARRKFLKSRETELRRALEVVEGYALARPDVAFAVRHEERPALSAPALGAGPPALRARIAQVFGPRLAEKIAEIPAAAAARLVPGAWGFVGGPETARGRRSFLFVNRRLVRDRALLAAFYRAVREEWRSDEFPSLFLFLDLPPEEVDVNVHPQKAEVRLRDSGLPERLGALLRLALGSARGAEPAPLATPSAMLDAGRLAWEGLGGRPPGLTGLSEVAEPAAASEFTGLAAPPGRLAVPVFAPLDRAPVPLSGRSGEPRPFRLLGQYKGTLILLEGPDGLYLIDQHVAHERILFERLRRTLAAREPARQRLVAPLLVELSRAESLRIAELAPALDALGFELAELSGGSWALVATPGDVPPETARGLVAELAADREASPENLVARILEAMAAESACKAAVKMHHPLSADKLEALVAELFRAENPYACPHGRPVVLALPDADLERRFGRR